MSRCCASTAEAACAGSGSAPGACPVCAAKAKSVATLTVKSLVRDHTRVAPDQAYWFCRTRDCEVIYFSDKTVFRKAELKVRVGLKERAGPIPLCYCFGYDREDVKRDIEAHGTSQIPDRIKAEVAAGFCACEVKNPAGTCCLGELKRAVKELEGEAEAHS